MAFLVSEGWEADMLSHLSMQFGSLTRKLGFLTLGGSEAWGAGMLMAFPKRESFDDRMRGFDKTTHSVFEGGFITDSSTLNTRGRRICCACCRACRACVELVVELVVFYVELVELVETENDCSLQSFFVSTSSTSST